MGLLETVEDKALKDEISAHPSRKFIRKWRADGARRTIFIG